MDLLADRENSEHQSVNADIVRELPYVEDQEQVIQLEVVDQKITLEFLQAIFNPGQAAHSVFYNPDEVCLL